MNSLRLKSKIILTMIKEKVNSYEVPDMSRFTIQQLTETLDDSIFEYIKSSDDLKANDKVLNLYKHMMTLIEHHKVYNKGWW